MIHTQEESVKRLLFRGGFGIEKESLRITEEGRFALTPHPFLTDPALVRDFCENQLEINTGVSNSPQGALEELKKHHERAVKALKELNPPEYLWPFSNPPYIYEENEIPVAWFTGNQKEKTLYRNHLAEVYGRYRMTFCGIHVNYSPAEELLQADYALTEQERQGKQESQVKREEQTELTEQAKSDSYREYRDGIYLDLTKNLVYYSWIVTVLLAASPLLDSSFLRHGTVGETDFSGRASVRCSEMGYWNHFVPVLDYTDLDSYASSIRRYITEGRISGQSELYYPVRIKSKGVNNLEHLVQDGPSHVELRNIDLNPFVPWGLEEKDLKFIHLLAVFLLGIPAGELGERRQNAAVLNYKNAAHYDIDKTHLLYVDPFTKEEENISVREASLRLLTAMERFYEGLGLSKEESWISEILTFERRKLTAEGGRYAEQVRAHFSEGFVRYGLKYLVFGKSI